MSIPSAGHWVKFFNASGIPSPTAATYAHIFVENRIQMDMLMYLNKEYLREMGINILGDIIAILRHAKNVNDQTAREKVLSAELPTVPMAAISPVAPTKSAKSIITHKTTSNNSATTTTTTTKTTAIPKPPTLIPRTEARRVLPEHEGKYKIKFPTGTTPRSKDILAKSAKLYADRYEHKSIFKRLSKTKSQNLSTDDDDDDDISTTNNENEAAVRAHIRSSGGKATTTNSASIFERLGDKTVDDKVKLQNNLQKIVIQPIKPILKNISSPLHKKSLSTIVKAKTLTTARIIKPQTQKVLLVKKVPLRVESDDDEDDDYNDDDDDRSSVDMIRIIDDDMAGNAVGTSEKIVKFAAEAEVHEISNATHFSPAAERRTIRSFNNKNDSNVTRNGSNGGSSGIKSRLGYVSKLHGTKKSYNLMKNTSKKSPTKTQTIRLKSDELLLQKNLPVHERLGRTTTSLSGNGAGGGGSGVNNNLSKLAQRLGKVDLSNVVKKQSNLTTKNSIKRKIAVKQNQQKSSVFSRLGYSRK